MTAATAAKPRFRRRTVLLGLAVALVVGFVATLLVRRELAARRLAAVIAELDRSDPGWRLDDLERARPAVPDAENLARVLATPHPLLPPPAATPYISDDTLGAVPPNVRLTDAQVADVRTRLAPAVPAIPVVLALADFPRGRHVIHYDPNGVLALVMHYDQMRRISLMALHSLALLAVQDGDAARALTAFQAQLNLGRSVRHEPLQAAPGIRGRHTRYAIRYLERLLGHAALPADRLATVRRELAAELTDDPWPGLVRSQRAHADRFMNALRRGDVKMGAFKAMLFTGKTPTPVERVSDWLGETVGLEVDPAHAFALNLMTRILATQSLPWPERKPAVDALYAEWKTGPEPARWLERIDFPARLTDLMLDQVRLRTAIAAIAAEQHRLAHGNWPASLAVLGPLPDDPFTGKPLLFKRTADGVIVYSVGPNLRDDGGELATDDGNIPKDGDVGFRLWDVPQRNRPPGGGP